MLNIGQVVYDYTNERVIIFAGLEVMQSSKTGNCHTEFGFILKDGTFIHLKKDGAIPFRYTNLVLGDKPYVGAFVDAARCLGHYFGIIDGDREDVKEWAKEAIEETEALIAERGGFNVKLVGSDGSEYPVYHIKNAVKVESNTPILDREKALWGPVHRL